MPLSQILRDGCRGRDVTGVTVEAARASYGEVIDRQERLHGRDVDLDRAVL